MTSAGVPKAPAGSVTCAPPARPTTCCTPGVRLVRETGGGGAVWLLSVLLLLVAPSPPEPSSPVPAVLFPAPELFEGAPTSAPSWPSV
eukprot:CAMPEP_0173449378 /NCGR_PEP_ID=MMETSP1357-20121228/42624_1 /TAXON_ID=77926 /ORGANISM="Hemiselmis rufescens, Strain PCC563" /LENGTH=87 /DNA_ID=CAMNT_0014415967 /DNA_START=94 /DNA_END=354 /DNA_ORIENTATION=-